MKESKYIEQMMVIGADQKFAAALIVPAAEELNAWAKEQLISYSDKKELLSNPRVLELYKGIVESFNPQFNQVEQIKKFELLPDEWTVDGGELTPTLKLKRKVIMEKYKSAVDKIYT
jgi:long-chain acyl-CoA synthetase